MIQLCELCGHHYDDEQSWTICPHGPLWAAPEAYCRKHDLVNCKLHNPPDDGPTVRIEAGIAFPKTQMFQSLAPIMATTWCGSRVDIRGRFWQWLFGWLRGGWRPSAFRMRREARKENNS